MSLLSNAVLGRGLSKINDGPFVFAGASKGNRGQNYNYYAVFIERVDIFTS